MKKSVVKNTVKSADKNAIKAAENAIHKMMELNTEFSIIGKSMLEAMKAELTKKVTSAEKASLVAPCEIPLEIAMESDKFPKNLMKPHRGRKNRIFLDKGEYYTMTEIASKYGLTIAMLQYRLKKGWNLVRAFGTDNHRKDHYIAENIEMMRV
jgi:hypothetical protein